MICFFFSPPCIPYVGLVLQDLTFVHIGNPDTFDGKVNFAKRWQQFNILVRDFKIIAKSVLNQSTFSRIIWCVSRRRRIRLSAKRKSSTFLAISSTTGAKTRCGPSLRRSSLEADAKTALDDNGLDDHCKRFNGKVARVRGSECSAAAFWSYIY